MWWSCPFIETALVVVTIDRGAKEELLVGILLDGFHFSVHLHHPWAVSC